MLKIALPILGVSDSAVAEKFYCGQLGFRREYAYRPDPSKLDPCYMGVVRDGARLVLSSFAGDGPPGTRNVQIYVEDAAELRREFVEAGVSGVGELLDQTLGQSGVRVCRSGRQSTRLRAGEGQLTWNCSGRTFFLASLGRVFAAEFQVVRRRGGQTEMQGAERRIHEDVDLYGWHAMNVLAEGSFPSFQYSIGFYRTVNHPEVLIIGQPREVMHGMLSVVADGIRDGRRYEAGVEADDILDGYRCLMQRVHESQYDQHVGWAIRFYRCRAFPVVQCIWPDLRGYYPWDDEASDELRRREPVISER